MNRKTSEMTNRFSDTDTPGKRTSRLIKGLLLPAAVLAGCIVPSDDVTPDLNISLVSQGHSDTIAPFGIISISFSRPMEDSAAIAFDITPPSNGYHILPNSTRDTFQIILSDPLKGNARYVLRPGNQVYTGTPFTSSEATDSIVFFTFATEHEPNRSSATADTLSGRRYGSISTLNDTDCYLTPAPVSAVYLHSFGSITTLFLSSNADTVYPELAFETRDTITIPDSLSFPISVTACASQKSAGGYYEIGVIE